MKLQTIMRVNSPILIFIIFSSPSGKPVYRQQRETHERSPLAYVVEPVEAVNLLKNFLMSQINII